MPTPRNRCAVNTACSTASTKLMVCPCACCSSHRLAAADARPLLARADARTGTARKIARSVETSEPTFMRPRRSAEAHRARATLRPSMAAKNTATLCHRFDCAGPADMCGSSSTGSGRRLCVSHVAGRAANSLTQSTSRCTSCSRTSMSGSSAGNSADCECSNTE